MYLYISIATIFSCLSINVMAMDVSMDSKSDEKAACELITRENERLLLGAVLNDSWAQYKKIWLNDDNDNINPDQQISKQKTTLVLLAQQKHTSFTQLPNMLNCKPNTRTRIWWHKKYITCLVEHLLNHGANPTIFDQKEVLNITYWSVAELLVRRGMKCRLDGCLNITSNEKGKSDEKGKEEKEKKILCMIFY